MTAIALPHLTHPALSTGILTPPLTPVSPPSPTSANVPNQPKSKNTSRSNTLITSTNPPKAPNVNYALLRSHHASALKYQIAKLRYDQANNGYIRGESAWQEHNNVISELEDELKAVQAAQKSLDQFPGFCFFPIADPKPKPYGPDSKSQMLKRKEEAAKKQKELDAKLDKQFPFIQQLFIGPKTKQQARDDRALREALIKGDFEQVEALLPEENMAMAANGGKRVEKKRPYEEVRMEKESAKIKKMLKEAAREKKDDHKEEENKEGEDREDGRARKVSTVRKEDPGVIGPKTNEEKMLTVQRAQRHLILNFLRKPWPVFDQEAAGLMEKMGRLAIKRLSLEAKAKDTLKEKETKNENEKEKEDKPKDEKKDEKEKEGEEGKDNGNERSREDVNTKNAQAEEKA